MRKTVEGLYTYLEFAACALAWVPILAAARARHGAAAVPRVPGQWMRRFGRVTYALTPLWKFSVEGAPPADIHTRPYVVVANHASNADPFLLSQLRWDMQWVGKEELFRLPVIGWMLKLSGDIPVRRGDGESVRAMLATCRNALKNGLSVMIFPEGTRSGKAGMGRFKDGAFELAIDEGAPVLPIAVAGTHRCMPKGSWRLMPAHAVVRVLEPIETRGLTRADAPRIRDLAQAQVEDATRALEEELTAELERGDAHGTPGAAGCTPPAVHGSPLP